MTKANKKTWITLIGFAIIGTPVVVMSFVSPDKYYIPAWIATVVLGGLWFLYRQR